VDLAVEANCNLLRIWGGGYYVGSRLLNWCDERGVLVWHDLAFACSKYPADDPRFLAEVREEVRWNVRDMASHPSLAVWCGNNELEWGVWAWGYADSGKALPDYSLFHHVIPVVLKQEDTSRPYWPSSPYSEGHRFPNEATTGDQHPWDVTLGQYGPDFWAYRTFVDRFPNEGGVLGASSPATLKQCLGDQYAFRSFAWEHHDNAANFWHAQEGITYRTVKLWLGLDAAEMALESYCFAGALLQAEGLCEYIGNYRRRMYSSSSAIFWMYNDSWPATHGWTIVDYYLRKKLAFHPVRRAFRPVSVVVAEDEGTVRVFGVNDSPEDWSGELRCGLFRFAGGMPTDETCAVTLPGNASTPLAEIPRDAWEREGLTHCGAFAVLLEAGQVVAQHRLLLERFCALALVKPQIDISREPGAIRLRSDAFAWGVCLDLDGEAPLADNCFDLLPGVEYTLPWPDALGEPRVVAVGNDLVVG
jgi:beta-mannosidase